jgi:hypothetical protein
VHESLPRPAPEPGEAESPAREHYLSFEALRFAVPEVELPGVTERDVASDAETEAAAIHSLR